MFTMWTSIQHEWVIYENSWVIFGMPNPCKKYLWGRWQTLPWKHSLHFALLVLIIDQLNLHYSVCKIPLYDYRSHMEANTWSRKTVLVVIVWAHTWQDVSYKTLTSWCQCQMQKLKKNNFNSQSNASSHNLYYLRLPNARVSIFNCHSSQTF